jgi:hypothetical protein
MPLSLTAMQAFTSITRTSRRSILSANNLRAVAAFTTHLHPNSASESSSQSQASAKTHFGFRDVLESEKEQLGTGH